MEAITVGIAEDNPVLAQGIFDKLALSDEIQVVLQARNGTDLLDKLSHATCLPHVLLMDIEMDGMDGIEATRQVKTRFPTMQVMMLTVFDDDDKIFEALKAGASGYLLKDEKPGKLIQALSEVLEGGLPMSPAIAARVLGFLRNKPNADVGQIAEDKLTAREREILGSLKTGMSVRQIAEKFFVSEKTVHKHLEHIYEKMHVKSSRELLAKLYKK